jgi:hypothetical protein
MRQARQARLSGAVGPGAAAMVVPLLDMLAGRLGCAGEVERSGRMLSLVLNNATTKGEPKYRRLKARNDKLWTSLLQHPEVSLDINAGAVQLSNSTCYTTFFKPMLHRWSAYLWQQVLTSSQLLAAVEF